MTPAQQRRIVDVLASLDDCVSDNFASFNLVGIMANLRKLRTIRRQLDEAERIPYRRTQS